MKTDIAQILSLAKDVYLWGNHSYPQAGFMKKAIRYITEKKSYLDQIGHISYYLHITYDNSHNYVFF